MRLCLLLAASASTSVLAQTTCEILEHKAGGSYSVQINGVKLLAITEEQQRKFLTTVADLDAANSQLAACQKLIEQYRETIGNYETTYSLIKDYSARRDAVLDGYKDLVKDYKKLHDPWFRVSLGVGATGGDTDPAILGGLSIFRVHVWGFFQERNTGVLIGTHLDLF